MGSHLLSGYHNKQVFVTTHSKETLSHLIPYFTFALHVGHLVYYIFWHCFYLLEIIVKRLKSLAKTSALSSAYLCSFRQKPSDVHPKPSDVHQKPSDAHQKASDVKLIAMETVATTPKIVSAEEYSRKPFTLHFFNLSISVAEG